MIFFKKSRKKVSTGRFDDCTMTATVESGAGATWTTTDRS